MRWRGRETAFEVSRRARRTFGAGRRAARKGGPGRYPGTGPNTVRTTRIDCILNINLLKSVAGRSGAWRWHRRRAGFEPRLGPYGDREATGTDGTCACGDPCRTRIRGTKKSSPQPHVTARRRDGAAPCAPSRQQVRRGHGVRTVKAGEDEETEG